MTKFVYKCCPSCGANSMQGAHCAYKCDQCLNTYCDTCATHTGSCGGRNCPFCGSDNIREFTEIAGMN